MRWKKGNISPSTGGLGGTLHLLGSERGLELARAGVSKAWDWQGMALGLVLALRKWRCPLGQGVKGSALGWLRTLVGHRARGRRVKGLAGISGSSSWLCMRGPPSVWGAHGYRGCREKALCREGMELCGEEHRAVWGETQGDLGPGLCHAQPCF